MSLWGARCGKPARRVLRGEGGTRGSPRPPSTQLNVLATADVIGALRGPERAGVGESAGGPLVS